MNRLSVWGKGEKITRRGFFFTLSLNRKPFHRLVEDISLMPSLCLSLRTLIHARKHSNELLIQCSLANQEFADASVHRNEQKGVLIAGFSYPLSPVLLPFSLSPYPLPFEFRRLPRSQWDSLHSKFRSKERPSLRPQTYFRSSLISLERRPEIDMLRKTEEREFRF